MRVPRVSLCAYMGGHWLVSRVCVRACMHRAGVGDGGGGRGWCVKACLRVGRAGVSGHAWGAGGAGSSCSCLWFNTMYWICVRGSGLGRYPGVRPYVLKFFLDLGV